MTRTKSASKLHAWCAAERGRAEAIARALSVSATSVCNWRRGAARPRPILRLRLEELTGGAVLAVGWERAPRIGAPS
jgi:hypothetical protein